MLGQRANDKFNRLLQKEGNITWSSTPSPPKLGNSMGPVSAPPSQEGMQAGQTLIPRQVVLVSKQVVLVPRQAGSSSQEGVQEVQVLSPRQQVLVPGK